MASAPGTARHGLSRLLAAALGGYGFTATGTALLARSLPLDRAEATTAATLLSILLFTGAVVWAFSARSVLRVWIALGGTSLLGVAFAAWRGLWP